MGNRERKAANGHSHCVCCGVPTDRCGKRRAPYTKKHAPARMGQPQKAGWMRQGGR